MPNDAQVPPPDEDAAQRVADEGDATDGPGDAIHVVVNLVHQLVCHRLENLTRLIHNIFKRKTFKSRFSNSYRFLELSIRIQRI
jgi:hypothetical protein